jgi:hypothetical protein
VTNKENLAEEKLLVYDGLVRSSDVIKQWVDKFSLFYSIHTNERDRLFSHCLLEQLVLRTASRIDCDRLVLCSGIVLHKIQINCLLGDVAQQIYDYSSTLKLHRIDGIVTASMASLLLLDSNNSGKNERRPMRSANARVSFMFRASLSSDIVVVFHFVVIVVVIVVVVVVVVVNSNNNDRTRP